MNVGALNALSSCSHAEGTLPEQLRPLIPVSLTAQHEGRVPTAGLRPRTAWS